MQQTVVQEFLFLIIILFLIYVESHLCTITTILTLILKCSVTFHRNRLVQKTPHVLSLL